MQPTNEVIGYSYSDCNESKLWPYQHEGPVLLPGGQHHNFTSWNNITYNSCICDAIVSQKQCLTIITTTLAVNTLNRNNFFKVL